MYFHGNTFHGRRRVMFKRDLGFFCSSSVVLCFGMGNRLIFSRALCEILLVNQGVVGELAIF